MKRILLVAVAAILTTSMALAQDIGVSAISPAQGTIFKKGVPMPFRFVIKNLGSTSIPQGTQFTVNIQFNNATPTSIPFTFNKFDPGDTLPLVLNQQQLPTFDNVAIGTDAVSFCVWTEMSSDINKNNDTLCRSYDLVTYKRDVGISDIVSPPSGTLIPKGVSTPITFTLSNYSDSAIEVGTLIPLQYRLGSNSPQPYILSIPSTIAANGSVDVTLNLTLNSTFPDGSTNICFSTNWGTNVDDFPGNDQSCETYNVGVGIIENAFTGGITVQPNPFRTSTQIIYTLNSSSEVVLKVFNVNGQEVKTLVNEKQAAGYHAAEFDASGLEKGLYIYRLQSGEVTKTGKLILD